MSDADAKKSPRKSAKDGKATTPGSKNSPAEVNSGGSGEPVKKYESKRIKKKAVPFDPDDSPAVQKSRKSIESTPKGGKGKQEGAQAKETESKELLYLRGDFLAVRNEEDGFYLCRAQQHVYETTKDFIMQWLEKEDGSGDSGDQTYTLGSMDRVDFKCILIEVKPQRLGKDKFKLAAAQVAKVKECLDDAIDGKLRPEAKEKKGKPASKSKNKSKDDDENEDNDVDGEDDEEEQEQEEEVNDEPKVKKPRVTYAGAKKGKEKTPAKTTTTPKTTTPKTTTSKTTTPKGTKKGVNGARSESESPPEKTRKALKGALIPRPSLIVWEKDPYLYSNEDVPSVSPTANSKMLFRAVYTADNKLLKKLIGDRKNIALLNLHHSVCNNREPLEIALINNNYEAVQLITEELFPPHDKKVEPRCSVTSSILARESTGRYNRLSLGGVKYIRPVALSRGSREGNNAFTKDYSNRTASIEDYIKACLIVGVEKKTLDIFVMVVQQHQQNQYLTAQQLVFNNIHLAVAHGHRKLAAEIMEDQIKSGVNTFQNLHKPVLQYDNEELQSGIRAASVKKRPWDNKKITPLHCAAINPNPKYLSKLLQILPEYNLTDGGNKRIIHYAAVCESTGPLELLLNRNVDPEEVDGIGMTALMLACERGRVKNVELLLSRAKKAHDDAEAKATKQTNKKKNKKGLSDEDDDDDDDNDDDDDGESSPVVSKYGIGGINRSIIKPQNTHFSYCPLHLAAKSGRLDCVEVLLKYGALVDKELSASKEKLTALMLASCFGFLDIIRVLVQNGAKLTAKDKLKRTALIHAAMNGQSHVVSYLLRQGLDPNQADSSGNTAVHYAVGYGWYYCTKALIQAGANANVANEWKVEVRPSIKLRVAFFPKSQHMYLTTPLAIAFMKGHMGLADLLLEQPKVDINCRLDDGLTLVSMACGSPLEDNIVEQLEYLIKNRKADCTLVDTNGMNALHHLAGNLVKNCVNADESKQKSVKMAELLMEKGCDASAKDKSGMTPVMYAVQSANDALLGFLCKHAGAVSDASDSKNQNILHYLSIDTMSYPLKAYNNMISNSTVDKSVLQQMARQVDSDGFTPLHLACYRYMKWHGVADESKSDESIASDNDDDDDNKDDDDDDDEDHHIDDEDDNNDNNDNDDDNDEEMEVDDNKDDEDDDDDGAAVLRIGGKAPRKQLMPLFSTSCIDTDKDKAGVNKLKLAVEQWQSKQNYIKTLYELCPAVAELPMEKRQLKPNEKKPETEEDCYFKQVAGFSALHFLIDVPQETEVIQKLTTAVADKQLSLTLTPALDVLAECIHKNKTSESPSKSDHQNRSLNVYNVAGATPLLAAILNNKENRAISLIKAGADVNAKLRNKEQNKNSNALLLACTKGLHALIPLLIKHGANVHDRMQRNVQTPLHVLLHNPVCKSKEQIKLFDSVKTLLDAGCNAVLVDKYLKTPLHTLVKHCRDVPDAVEVASLLIKAGVPVNSPDKCGRTALHLSVNANVGGANSSTVIEQFLLDNGADVFARDVRQRLPLHYVFVEIGKTLTTSPIDPVELCTTLTSAASTSGSDSVASMINHEDELSMTPLHLAACRGAGVCCIHLIQKGASVNVRNAEGNTPLSFAVSNGHESCTILLLQRNADISVSIVVPPPSPKSEKLNKNNNDDSEKEEDEELENKKKKEEKPAWLWKPLRKTEKSVEAKSYSLFQGVISRDWQGITFMMLDLLDKFRLTLTTVIEAALITNKYHLALSLIRKVRVGNVQDISSQISHGQTLAHVLAKSSTPEATNKDLVVKVAETLMERSVNFCKQDSFGCTPLHYACLQANVPLVCFILDKANGKGCLTVKDKLGRTPLAAVFWKLGHNTDKFIGKLTKMLIRDHNADPNVLCAYPNQQLCHYGYKQAADDEDYARPSASYADISPLMLAICQHNFVLTRELLQLGADVNFSDRTGRTPLMLAVHENAVDIVRLLLNYSYVKSEHEEDDEEFKRAETFKKQSSTAAALVKKPSRRKFGLALQRQGSIARVGSGGKKLSGGSAGGAGQGEEDALAINGLSMEVTTYPKTSQVNVRAVDDRCRSVLHYLVHSFPNGSYDNYRLLIQLVSVGAPLEQADGDGQTVLDYALAHGLPRLSAAIQCLLAKKQQESGNRASPSKSFSKPKRSRVEANDGIDWSSVPVPDFRQDSELHLSHVEKETKLLQVKQDKDEHEFKPDQNLTLASSGDVMKDADQGLPYDILLFKIDVSAGAWGLYNFYKMQIVHETGKDLYILFTKWGRIGDQGQFQQTPFPHLDDAVKEFKKIFRAKTGNDWLHCKNFEIKERKYRLVSLEERVYKTSDSTSKVEISLSPGVQKQLRVSKLHQYIQDLISELVNVTTLTRELDDIQVDHDMTTLGRVKKETLLKAKKILTQLESHVKTVTKLRQTHPISDLDAYKSELEKIAALTNEYFHLIPYRGYEFDRVPILDNSNLLDKELKRLETLMDLEFTTKMMLGAMHCINDVNPYDYIYRCLKCQIQLLNENDTVSQYILRYVSETFKGKVEAIYCISREGEDKRLDGSSNDNHRLLFHGSSSSNLLSILSRGLLVAPSNAPATGYRFGKGLYTADKFSKSQAYCYNYAVDSKTKFMLVCEVALGKVKDLYNTHIHSVEASEEFDCVRAVGQDGPDPLYDVTLPTGAVIPLGSIKKKHLPKDVRTYLSDSEYIVYRPEQVCLRYIVQFVD